MFGYLKRLLVSRMERLIVELSNVFRTIGPITVRQFGVELNEEAGRRLERSLQIISEFRPAAYRHMVQDISCILVREGHHAEYWAGARAILIDSRYVNDRPAETIASSLFHEAIHARIEAAGIPYRKDRAKRIEQVCLRRQVSFLRSWPTGRHPKTEAFINQLLANAEQQVVNRNWFTVNRISIIRALKHRRSSSRRLFTLVGVLVILGVLTVVVTLVVPGAFPASASSF